MKRKIAVVAAAVAGFAALAIMAPEMVPAEESFCGGCQTCVPPVGGVGHKNTGPAWPGYQDPHGSCPRLECDHLSCGSGSLDDRLREREVQDLLERSELGHDGAVVALLKVYAEDVVLEDDVLFAWAPCSDGTSVVARIELTGSQLAAVERRQQLAMK